MKKCSLVVWLCAILGANAAFGAELRDVIAHPEKYEQRHIDLVGVARVPDYFYLFADVKSAAKPDLSKALLVRKDNFAGVSYKELDRQWVRVTGVISSKPRKGWSPGAGLLLERAELLRDRPPPRIEDRTVLGVFQNTTAEPLAIDLTPRSDGGRTTFFLGPYEEDKTAIDEGQVVVSELKGPSDVPLDRRQVGRPIATCQITFRDLPPDYEYSPESSNKRTLYFNIYSDRIEQVPAPKASE
jgi:hypothetical protein